MTELRSFRTRIVKEPRFIEQDPVMAIIESEGIGFATHNTHLAPVWGIGGAAESLEITTPLSAPASPEMGWLVTADTSGQWVILEGSVSAQSVKLAQYRFGCGSQYVGGTLRVVGRVLTRGRGQGLR